MSVGKRASLQTLFESHSVHPQPSHLAAAPFFRPLCPLLSYRGMSFVQLLCGGFAYPAWRCPDRSAGGHGFGRTTRVPEGVALSEHVTRYTMIRMTSLALGKLIFVRGAVPKIQALHPAQLASVAESRHADHVRALGG